MLITEDIERWISVPLILESVLAQLFHLIKHQANYSEFPPTLTANFPEKEQLAAQRS